MMCSTLSSSFPYDIPPKRGYVDLKSSKRKVLVLLARRSDWSKCVNYEPNLVELGSPDVG